MTNPITDRTPPTVDRRVGEILPSDRPSEGGDMSSEDIDRPSDDRVLAANARVAEFQHGRVPRDLRLSQIVAIARHLFATRGYAATSMDDVASHAEVTKPVVYSIVESKQALFDAVIDEIAAELAGRVTVATTGIRGPKARLEAGVTEFFRFVEDNAADWELIRQSGSAGQRAIARIRNAQAHLVATMVGNAIGQNNPDLDDSKLSEISLAVAFAINGATEGLATWSQTNPGWSPEALGALIGAVFFNGTPEGI